jgi:hypothetical protein
MWLEEHNRRPEITSKPSTDAQVLEGRVARNLAILRTRNKKDEVPVATRQELDRVSDESKHVHDFTKSLCNLIPLDLNVRMPDLSFGRYFQIGGMR